MQCSTVAQKAGGISMSEPCHMTAETTSPPDVTKHIFVKILEMRKELRRMTGTGLGLAAMLLAHRLGARGAPHIVQSAKRWEVNMLTAYACEVVNFLCCLRGPFSYAKMSKARQQLS